MNIAIKNHCNISLGPFLGVFEEDFEKMAFTALSYVAGYGNDHHNNSDCAFIANRIQTLALLYLSSCQDTITLIAKVQFQIQSP
mgnify:CR=1 FL=1